jgi:hypothetical protein
MGVSLVVMVWCVVCVAQVVDTGCHQKVGSVPPNGGGGCFASLVSGIHMIRLGLSCHSLRLVQYVTSEDVFL